MRGRVRTLEGAARRERIHKVESRMQSLEGRLANVEKFLEEDDGEEMFEAGRTLESHGKQDAGKHQMGIDEDNVASTMGLWGLIFGAGTAHAGHGPRLGGSLEVNDG